MTTRNSQSGEKKQTSARETREPKPRIGVKEEPDIKSDAKPMTRQQEKLSARRRVEGLMKHVPNVREERKTATDGTQGPQKGKQPGMGPRTHERKGSANSRQSCGLIVRDMEKDASENPRCVQESDVSNQLVLNVRVGESGERSVRAEKSVTAG